MLRNNVCGTQSFARLLPGTGAWAWCAAFLLLFLSQCSIGVEAEPIVGAWGGVGARAEATPEYVVFEFDCASGIARVPLTADSSGRFRVEGSITFELGGPARLNERGPDPVGAAYMGKIDDNAMTLEVEAGQRHLGPFQLYRDQRATLDKCV